MRNQKIENVLKYYKHILLHLKKVCCVAPNNPADTLAGPPIYYPRFPAIASQDRFIAW